MGDSLLDEARGVIETDENGQPVFRARFNVQKYKPNEVNVKIDLNKLKVHAKHEEKTDNKSVSREYNREVDIPRDIDPQALQCSISTDGILTVDVPMTVPQYSALKDGESAPPSRGASTFTTFLSGALPLPTHQQQTKFQTETHQTTTPQSASPPLPPQQVSSSSFSNVPENERKFKVDVDIEDFAPEELSLKTVDKRLVISARREEKIGNRTSTKELNREIYLPETVDPCAVKAFFSDTGKLSVEAPYVRSVPISHYGEGHANVGGR